MDHVLSDSLAGTPIVVGQYVFWTDTRNQKMAIYGYDTSSRQEFLVRELLAGAGFLASDGQTLAWVEGTDGPGDSIHSYDLASRRESVVISAGGTEFGGLALDRNVLYYQVSGGLKARDLATGQEQLISRKGQNPGAADGKLLWSEMEQRCATPTFCLHHWILRMSLVPNTSAGIVLANSGGENGFMNYQISRERVLWKLIDAANSFVVYDVAQDTRKPVEGRGVFNAVIGGDIVAWAEGPIGTAGAPHNWSIRALNIDNGLAWTVVNENNRVTRVWGIVGQVALVYGSGERLHITAIAR